MADLTEYSIQITFKESGAEKTAKDIEKVKDSSEKLKSTIKGLGIGIVLKKATDAIGGFINKTSDYIETVNLFRASMGSAADQAQNFIDKAERLLGLDPKSMMDSISSFQNLGESLGISSDRAYIMSQNLTQLAGDLSSFANISFEEAQRKLLSGFSGQVKPLREYGIALNQASLQETAYALGIDQKVKNMTQAQKAELIYYQIMTSTTKMQGDLGRSLLSPANALRVMKTEFQRLARAIGSIFIPIMMKIIPVVRAVTQILMEAAQAIAKFFGFDMGNYEADLSSVGNMLTGVSDGIGDIGDAADTTAGKLNKMLMPFDELNNITSSTGTGGAGGLGGIGGGGGGLGIDLPQYDMFDSITGGMTEQIEKIKNTIKTLLPYIEAIGTAFAMWKISNKVINTLDKIFGLSDLVKEGALTITMGLTLLITGTKMVIGSITRMIEGDLTVENLVKGIFGGILGGAGATILTMSFLGGPLIGLTVGAILTMAVVLVWAFKKDEEFHQNVAKAQGLDYDGMSFIDKTNFQIQTKLEILGLKDTDGDTEWGRAIDSFHEQFKGKLTGAINGAIDKSVEDSTKKIPTALGFLSKELVLTMGKEWAGITGQFKEDWDRFWKIVGLLKTIKWQEVVKWVKELPGKLQEKFDAGWEKFKEIGKNIVEGIIQGIKDDWENFWDIADTLWQTFTEHLKTGWGIHSPSTVMEDIGKNLIQGLTGGIQSLWGTLTEKFNNIKNLTNFDWKLPNLKVPHFSWTSQPASGQMASILSKLNLPTSLPKLNISWYAQGGFPDVGQLFIANEAGPELVGNIGNRTAVANKDQITAAIANATYQAMSRALAENGQNDGQPIIVNVGNEQLYKGMANYKNQQSNMYGINV